MKETPFMKNQPLPPVNLNQLDENGDPLPGYFFDRGKPLVDEDTPPNHSARPPVRSAALMGTATKPAELKERRNRDLPELVLPSS